MELHRDEISRTAYNKFRVSAPLSTHRSANFLLFHQDRVCANMKADGEGFWVQYDEVPKRYKDSLVTKVSK